MCMKTIILANYVVSTLAKLYIIKLVHLRYMIYDYYDK